MYIIQSTSITISSLAALTLATTGDKIMPNLIPEWMPSWVTNTSFGLLILLLLTTAYLLIRQIKSERARLEKANERFLSSLEGRNIALNDKVEKYESIIKDLEDKIDRNK